MARQVSYWQSNDGQLFNTYAEAAEHDAFIAEVQNAMLPLGPDPDFKGLDGYLQHPATAVETVKRSLIDIMRRRSQPGSFWHRPYEEIYVHGIAVRYLEDSSPVSKKVATAWYRLTRIDEHGREWNQPYFAMHPNKAERFKLLS